MNLEDFNYHIPEVPSVEALLKDIIKILKSTNENINFLAFHIAQDLIHLPPGIFTNDDEDNEE